MNIELFNDSERMYVPIEKVAHPDDICIFGDHFGEHTYYASYAGIARKYAPHRILEIGVRYGYSGLALCWGAIAGGRKKPCYVGMDAEYFSGPGQSYRLYRSNSVAAENFERFAPQVNAKFFTVNTQSQAYPPQVINWTYQLINVDGDHSYEGCLKDLNGTWDLLAPRGIAIIDDTGMAGVKAATEAFISSKGETVDWQFYPNERGFCILMKRSGSKGHQG